MLVELALAHLPDNFAGIDVTAHRHLTAIPGRDRVILNGSTGKLVTAEIHQRLQPLFHAQKAKFHVRGHLERTLHAAAGHRHGIGKTLDLVAKVADFGCRRCFSAAGIVAKLRDLHLQVADIRLQNAPHVPKVRFQQVETLPLAGQKHRCAGTGRLVHNLRHNILDGTGGRAGTRFLPESHRRERRRHGEGGCRYNSIVAHVHVPLCRRTRMQDALLAII